MSFHLDLLVLLFALLSTAAVAATQQQQQQQTVLRSLVSRIQHCNVHHHHCTAAFITNCCNVKSRFSNNNRPLVTIAAAVPPNKSNNNNNNDEEEEETPFGLFLRGIVQTGMSKEIKVNSIVIAKKDIPSLKIWMDQSYRIESIYLQGNTVASSNSNSSGVIEKIPLETMTTTTTTTTTGTTTTTTTTKIGGGQYTQYLTVFNPVYHDSPVVVTPEEMGLVTLRDEVTDSILFALPVLGFWITTSFVFANTYQERYGGNFMDAFWGR